MSFPSILPSPGDSETRLVSKLVRAIGVSVGQGGHDVFSSALSDIHLGSWVILHALTSCNVTITRDEIIETISLVAVDRIYGKITSVQVNSGTVELYRA
jgi:hypothetical protein